MDGSPIARSGPAAVWTGSRLVIWGGEAATQGRWDGGAYDPQSDSWEPINVGGGRPTAAWPTAAATVWTGRELIYWGGVDFRGPRLFLDDGAAYEPATGTWRALPPSPLEARGEHAVVWTGSEMLVFGGHTLPNSSNPEGLVNDGARYIPPC
jgi:hypothetical protein